MAFAVRVYALVALIPCVLFIISKVEPVQPGTPASASWRGCPHNFSETRCYDLWSQTPFHVSGPMCAEISKVCSAVSDADHAVLQKVHVLETLAKTKPGGWETFWDSVTSSTRVAVVLSSYDRAPQLRNVLVSLTARCSGMDIWILYDGSSRVHIEAYHKVLRDFPAVFSLFRPDYGGFFNTLKIVLQQDVTNILVASDDTFFVRGGDLRRHGALLRVLETSDARVSVQMRLSFPPEGTPPAMFAIHVPQMPLMYLADTHQVFCKEYHPLCYDRHIDGPMYLRSQLVAEWNTLVTPTNPGELEGIWMASKQQHPSRDFSLFPEHQWSINLGSSLVTVRTDRLHTHDDSPERLSNAKLLRSELAQAIIDGCTQNPLSIPDAFWHQPRLIDSLPALPWTCPAGVTTPNPSS